MKKLLTRVAQVFLILNVCAIFYLVHGFIQIFVSGMHLGYFGYNQELVYKLNLYGFVSVLTLFYSLLRISLMKLCKQFDSSTKGAACACYIATGIELYTFLFDYTAPHLVCRLVIAYELYNMWLLCQKFLNKESYIKPKGGDITKCARIETVVVK